MGPPSTARKAARTSRRVSKCRRKPGGASRGRVYGLSKMDAAPSPHAPTPRRPSKLKGRSRSRNLSSCKSRSKSRNLSRGRSRSRSRSRVESKSKNRSRSRSRSLGARSGSSNSLRSSLSRRSSRGEQILALARESEVPKTSPAPELETSLRRLSELGTKAYCTPRDPCCRIVSTLDEKVSTKDKDRASLSLCIGMKRVFWACASQEAVGEALTNTSGTGIQLVPWAQNIGKPVAVDAFSDDEVFVVCKGPDIDDHGESFGQLLLVRRKLPPCVLLARLQNPRAVAVSPRSGEIYVLDTRADTRMEVKSLPGDRVNQALPGHNPVLRSYERVLIPDLARTAIDIHALNDGRLMVAHATGKLCVYDVFAGTLDLVLDSFMSFLEPGCLQKLSRTSDLCKDNNMSAFTVSSTHDTSLGVSAVVYALHNVTFDPTTGEPLCLGNESVCVDGPWALEFDCLPAQSVCVKADGKAILLHRDGALSCTKVSCENSAALTSATTARAKPPAPSGPIKVVIQTETKRASVQQLNAELVENDRLVVKHESGQSTRFKFEDCLMRPRKDGSPRSCHKYVDRALDMHRTGNLNVVCVGSPLTEGKTSCAEQVATRIIQRALVQLAFVTVRISHLLRGSDKWVQRVHIVDEASSFRLLLFASGADPSCSASSDETADEPDEVTRDVADDTMENSLIDLYRFEIEAGPRTFVVFAVCSADAEQAAAKCIREVHHSRTVTSKRMSSSFVAAREALRPALSGAQSTLFFLSLHLCGPPGRMRDLLVHATMALQIPWRKAEQTTESGAASPSALPLHESSEHQQPRRPISASVPMRRSRVGRSILCPSSPGRVLDLDAVTWVQDVWTRTKSELVLKAVFAMHDDASVGWLHGVQIARLLRNWLHAAQYLAGCAQATRLIVRRPEEVALYFEDWALFISTLAKSNPRVVLEAVRATPWLTQSLQIVEETYHARATSYRAQARQDRRRIDETHIFWKFVYFHRAQGTK